RLLMASTPNIPATFQRREDPPAGSSGVVAVITAEELQAAKRDPRVRSFLDEADAYLDSLESQDRNR
ncbi:MAG: hypothetical protein LC777_04980, partial [Actinobacteria bacterium]|nr:hypothetical protein [Actinomycetota bacterium]